MTATTNISIDVPDEDVRVGGILTRPEGATAMLVFAHGAGAAMTHQFMEDVTARLADQGIATLRYNFPYMQLGKRRPDRPQRLQATVLAAIDEASRREPSLPLFAGGKSLGGRMTSNLLARDPDTRVLAVVFFGFPLHPARKPSTSRADHLPAVRVPMLFLQGTRDDLADLDLLRPICGDLPDSTLHVVEHADHAFKVLKRSGRTADAVLDEIVGETASYIAGISEIKRRRQEN